jgi:uncharacterized NAD-dependent epimerase/dehydratase family protein
MSGNKTVQKLQAPYLVFIGDTADPMYAKTGFGLVQWVPENVVGQLRLHGCKVKLDTPELSLEEAVAQGARSLIIGVAPVGGALPEHWNSVVMDAIALGMDIVAGLHSKLRENPEFVEAAKQFGVNLVDVRIPPRGIPVGNGQKRAGKCILTVGTDCAVGKKYTALAMTRSMNEAGFKATFRATGQTGIMIAGEGIPLDAVVADFISGAAELVSPANEPDHWDVVEGQGSLFNPGYAGVTLGLVHGSQPDALIMCHRADIHEIQGWPGYPIPPLDTCMSHYLAAARLTNPAARFIGISVNTSRLPEAERSGYLRDLGDTHGLPSVDPLVDGTDSLVEYLRQHLGEDSA